MEKGKSKQVLVVRKDLRNTKGEKIRTGKYISQGAHASLKAILDLMSNEDATRTHKNLILNCEIGSALEDWINGIFTKITVYVNSEAELLEVYNKAKDRGLICALITDAGLTEFKEPTITCCAIGPVWSSDLEGLTDHLPLM